MAVGDPGAHFLLTGDLVRRSLPPGRGLCPLGSELARIIGIALLIVFWGLRALLRELKAARASKKLVQAVAKQEDPTNARASADTRQMQQRFEEATNALQKSSKAKSLCTICPGTSSSGRRAPARPRPLSIRV